MGYQNVGSIGGLKIVAAAYPFGGGVEAQVDLEYAGKGGTTHTLTVDEATRLAELLELAVIRSLQMEQEILDSRCSPTSF